MNIQQLKQNLIDNDPELKKEMDRFDLWFEIEQRWLVVRTYLKIYFADKWRQGFLWGGLFATVEIFILQWFINHK